MVSRRERHQRTMIFDLDSGFGQFSDYADQLWGQFLGGNPRQPAFRPSAFQPPVDVCQTPDSVIVLIEVPGMRGQEVRLELGVNRLTIGGKRSHRRCSDAPVYSQMEIACGQFERTVLLPSEVDPERAEVRYDDGYIEIRLPRLAHRIEQHFRVIALRT